MIATTQGKPDQKILDGFNERVDAVNKRLEKYKTTLNDVEKNSIEMLQRWREALTGIRDPELDRSSRANLEETRDTYEKMDAKLRDNYSRMDRLSKDFREQKIFMQVNPAVEASAPLRGKLGPIEQELGNVRRQVVESDQLAETFRKKLQP